MKLFFLLICTAAINLSGVAQTISITGNIKDIKSNSPIENAKVQIKNSQNGLIDSVYSDAIGNWQYDIATYIDDDIIFLPTTLEVQQNFPNPFNPSTKINFSIPSDGTVTISVHNILGELVDQKNAVLMQGIYIVDWYSKGSAGIYLYTISFENQSITKKMIQLDGGNGIGLGEIRTGIAGNFIDEIAIPAVNVEIVITKLGYAADSTITTILGGENFSAYLQTVHSKYTMIDLHNDVLEVMVNDPDYHLATLHTFNHTDIPRLQQGEVDVQFFSIWVDPDSTHYTNYFQRALIMRDRFYSELGANPTTIAQATTMQQALEFNNQNKIAGIIGVEGGHHIENNLDNLDTLYNAGMRYLTITWNNSTNWAISARDSRTLTHGLTEFGRQVIRKLDSLGVIIDVSHVGIKTIQDILDVTTNPIVATHSGVRALRNNSRNLYDWQIQDIANSGGVIGIVFYPPFLSNSSPVYISNVIQHIDHIVNLVGVDYVAIGSDFDGIGTNVVVGLEDVSKFPDLTLALLQHGYTELEVAKILGGNFRRVFERVCGNK
jgi:membrane dipeptidase